MTTITKAAEKEAEDQHTVYQEAIGFFFLNFKPSYVNAWNSEKPIWYSMTWGHGLLLYKLIVWTYLSKQKLIFFFLSHKMVKNNYLMWIGRIMVDTRSAL